jgi:hypothetical protein
MRTFARLVFVAAVWIVTTSPAAAHFPWLALDDEGRVVYFFGEDISDRRYHMPESLAKAQVFHVRDGEKKPGEKKQSVALASVESDTFLGNRSQSKFSGAGALVSKGIYGVYHGTKLTYYTQHLLSSQPEAWPTKPGEELELQGLLKKEKDGVALTILWKGKPLPDAKIALHGSKETEKVSKTTDRSGNARFTTKELASGLNGVLVGHVIKEQPGELGGKAFTSESHYLTITFVNAP